MERVNVKWYIVKKKEKKKKKVYRGSILRFPKVRAIKDKAWIQPEMEHVALDSTRVCIILSGPTYSDSFWKPSILLVPLFPLFLSLEIRLRIVHTNVYSIRGVCRSNYRELNHPKTKLLLLNQEDTNVEILSSKIIR